MPRGPTYWIPDPTAPRYAAAYGAAENTIAKLASAFMILAFMGENLAVVFLRETSPQWYKPTYQAPLYPVMQAAGVLVGIVLLAMLGWIGAAAIVVADHYLGALVRHGTFNDEFDAPSGNQCGTGDVGGVVLARLADINQREGRFSFH